MAEQASQTLVMKFGGTSVGSTRAMAGAVEIIQQARAEWGRVVVVTSALSGVTNQLLESAERAVAGEVSQLPEAEQALLANHVSIAAALIPDEAQRTRALEEISGLVRSFVELCSAIAVLGEATPRALDAVAGLGERMSIRLLAAACEAAGVRAQAVEATRLIVTNDRFQNAHPDFGATTFATRSGLLPLLEAGIVPIVTGFIGATPQGVLTTLGRGGSDYSAAILGAVLPADEVWIWTDVNGVMTADPRMVPNAQTLAEISYSEIAELAYYGAKVLHPKTVRPVVEAGIGLRICNTFNPSHPGTWLVANGQNGKPLKGEKVLKAVTAIRKQRLITIEGRGMLGVPGVAARAFAAVASTGTSVPLITQASSEQSICFAVPAEAADAVLGALQKVFALELADNDIDRVWATEDVAIITVVGTGARHTPGISGRVFSKLGDVEINVLAIAHGSSDVSISMVVESAETEKSVRALHELIVS
jgi:aspartate kinase